MNNLFIMHTQYNLILACGIIESKYQNDRNDLLLHAEFKLSRDYKNRLKKIFQNIYYVQEEFSSYKPTIQNELNIFSKVRKAKDVIKNKYDNVFLTQEEYFDTLILSKIGRNCEFNCMAIEEDAYFSLDSRNNNLSIEEYRKKVGMSYKKKLLDYFHNILYGKNNYMHSVSSYGSSPIFSDVYVMYPKYVRRELGNKKLHEITQGMILSGVDKLYGDKKYNIRRKKSLLFFFDLIERYKNKELIDNLVKVLLSFCENNNLTFMYKYHPRESESFEVIETKNCSEQLATIIPSEKILADLYSEEVIVIGNATTAIQVSAKLGFKTYSIASIDKMKNEFAIEAFRKMGIIVPDSVNQLIKEIKLVLKGNDI